jgi:hypothetical protein
VEEVPSATQLASELIKSQAISRALPLQILFVVDEHLVSLRHNPDLPMSVSNFLGPFIFPTYICIILNVHRVRNKSDWFPLEENL